MLPDASEKSRSTFPNKRCPHVIFLSLRCQPTVSTPSSTAPSVPWRFLSLSLSALQYLYCQANNNASGFNLKVTSQCKHPSSPTVPAHYRTSGVQLLTSYLTNVATKPRSLTKQTRPSRFSCQNFSFQLPPPGMTPGSVAPRTVHSVRPGSTTTWPTCRDVTFFLQYFSSMDLCSSLPSSPFPF